MRMVLRLGAKKNAYTQEELDLFQTLETHIRDIREGNSEQWERISLTSKAVKQYSQTGIEEELLSAFGAKVSSVRSINLTSMGGFFFFFLSYISSNDCRCQFDLNSFNLTNAFYDRVGLYIHPYAALINHSCEYNAVMGFDGPELYIKAVRPIAKDEQIFISYVDTTYPKRIRQKELGGRYFFACQCKKCSGDEPPEPTGDAGVVCERAFALLQSGKAGDDKHRLSVTLQALITCELPKTKQPFVSIFDEIIVSDISDGALTHAFLNCALRFSRIDPVAYPYEGHPIRAVHAWTLAKVTLQISQESPELTMPEFVKGGWEDFLGTGEVSLDYGLLTWTLLAELVSKEAEYCTVPGFRTIVKKTFANVHEEFMRHGLDPRNMRDEIRAQWSKLGKLISGYFQCVLRDNS